MNKIFSDFHSNHIKEIHDFLNSDKDILYLSGYFGSGKSSVLKEAIKTYRGYILTFHGLCFENTVIDDFLLSFYDTFRSYAMKGMITLKKNPEEAFINKVSFYFKNLEFPTVVIIDNFEAIKPESEINDLLLHISGFDNVKLILVSKNDSCLLVENPTVSVERINFEKITYEQFAEIVGEAPEELLQDIYTATDGHELYIKMALSYLSSISVSPDDFMEEFHSKDVPFGDFIIEKSISLIPENYFPIMQNLALMNHGVDTSFIETYFLGDVKQIPYLLSKSMLSEFFDLYYIKPYLRNYITQNTNIQDKNAIVDKLIAIYENELKKSPKDRILRLSRETLRNCIKLLEESAPKISTTRTATVFGQKSKNSNWFVTGALDTPMQFSVKKPEPAPVFTETVNIEGPSEFEMALGKITELEKSFNYQGALDELMEAKKLANTFEEKRTIYYKITRNAVKMNDNRTALTNLAEFSEICLKENDIDSCSKAKIEIGKIFKKTYSFQKSKNCFLEVINNQNFISKKTLADAKIMLAEIYELENNMDSSIKEYKSAFDLILENESEKDRSLPEICYKMASLYDENGYNDEAFIEYQNSIRYSELSGNEIYLIKCYANCGVILSDMGQIEQALSYLLYAFDVSKDTANYLDTYYIARSIASVYANSEPEKAYDYLLTALDYARLSDNSFEIAISLLELGDYYYNSKQDEQALICYFQAKTSLGPSASKENLKRVTTRINDMKIKLGDAIFNGMQELYDV